MQVFSQKSLDQSLYAAQPFTIRHARTVMALVLIASDLLSLILAFSIAISLRLIFLGDIGNITPLLKTGPFLAIIFIVFAWQGLYRKGGINPVLELQLTTEGTSLIFLFVTAVTFITQSGLVFSRFIIILAWLLTIILLPLLRNILRSILSKRGLWGEVVAVVGNGRNAQELADEIASNPYIGFKPVAILSDIVNDYPSKKEKRLPHLSFAQPSDVISYLIRAHIRTIIMVQGEISDSWTQELSNTPKNQISNVIIVPTSAEIYTVNIRAHDLGSTVALEIRNNLQSKWGQWVKRSMDILIVLLISPLTLPLTFLISILIKLDSSGPVFYRQTRVGKQGKHFEMWKFRTMVQNADHILAEVLEQDEGTRAEWIENQKLKNDPRITRVGKWLRKWSLDELPQTHNVFWGQMSMVGPRPFMPDQDQHYGKILDLYQCVPPGMTGLWQVSGRNTTNFEKRVALDGYYVKNWSVWMDIYILFRTIWVVLRREGAY